MVVSGYPHHVTQRGNRRQPTFFPKDDYHAYLELMAHWCGHCGVEISAYWLMPNHVHLIAGPAEADGLRRAISEAHRRYTRRINLREGWRGHLCKQGGHVLTCNLLRKQGGHVLTCNLLWLVASGTEGL